MRIKAKTKDCHLQVKVKLSPDTVVDEQILQYFSERFFRGFLRPKRIKSRVLLFSGPIGITLEERLRKPFSKFDFFLLIEQIVDGMQRLRSSNLPWDKVLWDIKHSYYNETTKELQLLYLPFEQPASESHNIMEFVEQLIYITKPFDQYDPGFVSRFSYFLGSLGCFDTKKIEEYIHKEDRNAFNTIKRHNIGNSGFMTSKPMDYYKHYEAEQKSDTSQDLPTALLDDDEPTGLLGNEDATALLKNDDDEATGLLTDDGDATSLLQENDDGTALLDDTHYPTLFRIVGEETININKPVFRIGKERSYVDYFVSNNNAVSRSHADIITRGSRYFIVDRNSKNKTFINNQVISPNIEFEIVSNDRIRLGNEEFVFTI